MITSDADIRAEVIAALNPYEDEFDVEGIVRDIIVEHGLVSIDSLASEEWLRLLRQHDLIADRSNSTI